MNRHDSDQGQERGRRATTPSDVPAPGWWDIIWRTLKSFNDDRIMLVAAGVTYYALLALVPAIAAFLALYGLFFDAGRIAEQVQSLAGVIPSGAVEIVSDQATRIAGQSGGTLGAAFVIGLAISLWSANAGVKAMFDAMNVAYDETEKRSFLQLNSQSLLFTLGAIAFLIVALAALAVVPVILSYVNGSLATVLISLGRWPLLLAILVVSLAILYRYGPSREKAQWRWVTWGSAIAAIGWLVFSMLFSWYVANFGSYNKTYGSLGAVIGFMTWMWLSVTIVLAGAELNAELEHQTAEDTTDKSAQPMGQRGARMADTVGEAQR